MVVVDNKCWGKPMQSEDKAGLCLSEQLRTLGEYNSQVMRFTIFHISYFTLIIQSLLRVFLLYNENSAG
jgi:hypothetical protein